VHAHEDGAALFPGEALAEFLEAFAPDPLAEAAGREPPRPKKVEHRAGKIPVRGAGNRPALSGRQAVAENAGEIL